ncbi:MAG: double-strand break repair helicase AddA, partial [Novosphingobium sp.]
PLAGNQRPAVDPAESVWLSASAGTGKTQVLSARVLRLLLQADVDPSQILCLTFTKAGAAEMAVRIKEVLAGWVRADSVALANDLRAIGADFSPDVQQRARTLFARVLDCPGGGLRIDTIHAFAQWLLAAFPSEAGLTPGVRAMEDRDRELLQREVLAQLLLDAEARGDTGLLAALEMLSLRMGPDDVQRYLLRCAEAREAWVGPGSWQEPIRARVEQVLGLSPGMGEDDVHALCADDCFDTPALDRCLAVNRQWKAQKGQTAAGTIADWIAAGPRRRLELLPELAAVFLTKDGDRRSTPSLDKIDPAYPGYVDAAMAAIDAVREVQAMIALADWLTPALSLGRAFALAWEEAKARDGFIDFDDQIRRAAELLGRSEAADWIRYKLDRRFDHILVDEAQDTNAAQWRIIEALAGDFFAGEGARGDKLRTIFVVGDYKQAIFRFQGTSPENFEAARMRFKAVMDEAAGNAELLRSNVGARRLRELGLDQSFRTAQPVLQFVDMAIGAIGHAGFGLAEAPEAHVGENRPGYVAFWKPVGLRNDEDVDAEIEEGDEGGESWLSRPDRQLAENIARQVRGWMEHGFPLLKGGARRAGPGDVMVLVRKRRELAGLIVARLHAAGVPVAGVDRLRLGAPLAVRDLLSALRFAAQPLDDLNLAVLLVSPLIGWSQEQLLAHAFRPDRVRLWDHLRRSHDGEVAQAMERLLGLLARADYEPPQALLHWLLSGPWQGRRELVARLGREANDPIDELVNAAHAFSTSGTPSLAGFLNWFDAGEGELKREAGRSEGLVRVMTVHGSKGLQAPIVILADAAGNPRSARPTPLDLPDRHVGGDEGARRIPLPPLSRKEQVGRIAVEAEQCRREEMQEHWRLLYVAMTRAEEALFITGSLGSREKAPSEDSWYARLEALVPPGRKLDDPLWGYRLEHGDLGELPAAAAPAVSPGAVEVLPDWVTLPAGAEPRPARPLAPSSLGEELSADPPFPPGAGAQAARRGTLIHRLLERLPELPSADRAEAAARWLARNARDLDEDSLREIAQSALSVLADPAWADLFGPASLAEVPVAALVGERVVAGTIDRLQIIGTTIRIVDFKTARRPPERAEDVPRAIVRQMAAYAAALEVTYPGRQVEAALLYTQAPRLIVLPDARIAAEKAALATRQESL